MAHNTEDIALAHGIVTNPLRQGGRPTIEGTRITVERVLDKLAAGQTIDGILADYPHLTREQVVAAIAYATQLVREQSLAGASREADE
jgi:uncharacterized protein (DUF433 family)